MAHKYAGKTVREILRGKKASIRAAPLPAGSPDWAEFETMRWEEIEAGAADNNPGFKTVRKLLSDRRFDR
jgi:hypothetical protein